MDFIVSVYQIGKAVVTIVGKVIVTAIEFNYNLATGDVEAIKEDLASFGVWIGDTIQSAQDLIDLAKKGLAIFNQLNEDPETRDLVIDYFSSLYESIPYRDSRTIGIRIVAEIGIEVLLALATAGAANVARRVGQVGIKATRVGTAANRIGPFTKEAIELLSDLAKRLNTKNVVSEQLPPPQNPKIPAHAQNKKLDDGSKDSTIQPEDFTPNSLTRNLTNDASQIISNSTKGQLRRQAALSSASIDELGIVSDNFTNLPSSTKNFPGVSQIDDQSFIIDDKAAYMKQVEKLYADSGNSLNSVTRSRILDHIGDDSKHFPTQAGMPGLHAEVQSVNSVINQAPVGFELSKISVSTIKLAPSQGQGLPFPACSNCGGILSNSVNILTGVK